MKFNPGKYQALQITRSRSPIQTGYTMHGQTLEVVSCAKYLDMDISNGLSWKAHIARITENANQSLGFLRRNLKTTNPALREKAYKATVRPRLGYAAPPWDPHIQDDVSKNEMDQRRAARWVLGDYSLYSSVSVMLEKLSWRTLEQRCTDARLVLLYKIIYGYVAVPLPGYVTILTRISRTSHPLVYRQIPTRTDYYKCSFYPLTVVQWNHLSA